MKIQQLFSCHRFCVTVTDADDGMPMALVWIDVEAGGNLFPCMV